MAVVTTVTNVLYFVHFVMMFIYFLMRPFLCVFLLFLLVCLFVYFFCSLCIQKLGEFIQHNGLTCCKNKKIGLYISNFIAMTIFSTLTCIILINQCKVFLMQLCVMICQWLCDRSTISVGFLSTNKTDSHNISKIFDERYFTQ